MIIKPDYYDNFKCTCGKCLHNCCIGWEIDIDDTTLQKYNSISGDIGKKLKESISHSENAHFILSEDERCPFLNNENLCELIIYGGEDMLCQICRDHPRFYNEFEGITEKGIGLCCEAAAKLILSKTDKFFLVFENDNLPENDFLSERDEIFAILQNRAESLEKRISTLLEWANAPSPVNSANWITVYKALERLDPAWDKCLDSISSISTEIPENLQIVCEQLLCYFIFRHLSGALQDFLFAERIQFAVLSCYIILNASTLKTMPDIIETARMYSCEIEYSDENIEIILEKLHTLY